MSEKSSRLHTTLVCIAATACVGLYAWAYAIFSKTVVAWWMPVGGALTISAATALFLSRSWRWLTKTDETLYNVLCHILAVSAVGYFAILGCNYFMADAASEHEESVVVEHKIRRERDTYRRVGRNRMVKSGTRTVYSLDIVFDDGTEKRIPVTQREYNRTREGGSMTLTMQQGLLGFPVIKD